MTDANVWEAAVALEVRGVQDGGWDEPLRAVLERARDLRERYGDDAEEAFWDRVAATYAAGAFG